MGCFTTIIHPVDGRELQIKTGHDSCETYKVGDAVNWYIDPELPGWGALLDGVYDSCSGKGDDDDLVVIIDHKVAGVMSLADLRRETIESDLELKNREVLVRGKMGQERDRG